MGSRKQRRPLWSQGKTHMRPLLRGPRGEGVGGVHGEGFHISGVRSLHGSVFPSLKDVPALQLEASI